MDKLTEYKERYIEFTSIDDFNLAQTTKRVPAEKHYWVSCLIDAKVRRHALFKNKKKLKHALTEKVISEGIVNLNKKTLDDIENSDKFEELNLQIDELEFLIEYLELIVKNITFIGNDIKNMLTIKQLENE